MLRKLQQQAAALVQQWQPLLDACTEALTTTSSGTSSRRQALLAALTAFGVACAQDGWLPGALQELGSAVWSAFPQKFACNDPACNNLAGLTETSCAKKLCTDCKVARYCCKEHQLRHWPAHKQACKAIKKAMAANSSS